MQRYFLAGEIDDLTRAGTCAAEAVSLTATDDPLLPGRLNNLAGTLSTKYRQTGEQADLQAAQRAYDDAIAKSADNLEVRARLQHGRGMNYRSLYNADKNLDTLQASIEAFEAAVKDASPDSPDRSLYLGDLAMSLGTGFEEHGQRKDLDRAIELMDQAVERAPGPSELLRSHLGALALMYRIRFDRFSLDKDLRKSCAALRAVFALSERRSPEEQTQALQQYGRCLECRLAFLKKRLTENDPDGGTLSKLGHVQWDLFTVSRHVPLREEALDSFRRAIKAWSGKKRRQAQLDLAQLLRDLGDGQKSTAALNEAIALVSEATATAKKKEGGVYEGNLALMLIERYQLAGLPQDLRDGLAILERHLEEPETIETVSNYLAAVDLLFEQGDLARLDTAIDFGMRMLERFSEVSAPRCQVVSATATNLRRRYEIAGDPDDVTMAWTITLDATDQARIERSMFAPIYNEMGWAAKAQFEVNDEIEFLVQAIGAYQRAVDLAPGNPIYLTNLGSSFRARHAVLGKDADLDRAIDLLQQAVEGSAGVRGHDLALMSLANALSQRFRHSRKEADATAAIDAYREAVTIGPARVQQGAKINLSRLLLSRFAEQHAKQDLDEAIPLLESIEPAALPTQARAVHALALADAYTARSNSPADAQNASTLYRKAIDQGERFDLAGAVAAATSWMDSCFARQSWQEAVEVAERAIALIDRVLDVTLNLADKTRWLRLIGDLPTLCAYVFAKAGQVERAVDAVERSRARVMSESLELGRRDLDQLPGLGHTRLYQRLKTLSERLRSETFESEGSIYRQGVAAAAREKLEKEFAAVLADIRALPGFDNLLGGEPVADLSGACEKRRLVYLLATPAGGLALLASSLGGILDVRPIWLPALTEESVRRILGFEDLSNSRGYLATFIRYRHAPAETWTDWQNALDDACRWMGETIFATLLEEMPTTTTEPGLTLVPCGFLSLLPLHAARIGTETGSAYVSEMIPIGYSPNARAMIRYKPATSNLRLLLVASPEPVSASPLPYVEYETKQAEKVWPERDRVVLRGQDATVEKVVSHLVDCSIFHFAGHAHANIVRPGQSGIQLSHDVVLNVERLSALKIDLQLAILSGCETAVPGLESVNELIGLPTALVQAGTRGVIGSMWLVRDQSSALLIGEFHRYWRKDGDSPIKALHKAQQLLRDSGFEHPAYWAAFAFTGIE
jgi:tetratricopeptide (TPR) repeat protein